MAPGPPIAPHPLSRWWIGYSRCATDARKCYISGVCSALPVTRRIAHREAQQLFDLCAGFVYSQILLACVELGLFEHLRKGRFRSVNSRCACHCRKTPRCVCCALPSRSDLWKVAGEPIRSWNAGRRAQRQPGIAAMIRHHAMLYRDLRDPVSLLRGEVQTELSHYWAYADTDRPSELEEKDVAAYSALMASSQAMIADDILDAYPFDRHRCLLDIGGGEGAFIAAAAARFPQLCLPALRSSGGRDTRGAF